MKQLPQFLYSALVVAGLAAVFGAIPVRAWGVLLLAPATAALWAAYWLREPWAGSIGLAGFMGVLAYAVWLGVAGGWVLVGAVAAVVAWDLGHFVHRLGGPQALANEPALWEAHWRPLAAVVLLSLALGGVALTLQTDLSFWSALGLSLLTLMFINYIVSALGREG